MRSQPCPSLCLCEQASVQKLYGGSYPAGSKVAERGAIRRSAARYLRNFPRHFADRQSQELFARVACQGPENLSWRDAWHRCPHRPAHLFCAPMLNVRLFSVQARPNICRVTPISSMSPQKSMQFRVTRRTALRARAIPLLSTPSSLNRQDMPENPSSRARRKRRVSRTVSYSRFGYTFATDRRSWPRCIGGDRRRCTSARGF